MPQHHHQQHQQHEEAASTDASVDLDAYTRDVLAGGIQGDLLRARMAQLCSQAPAAAIQVQVDRSKSSALADTLRNLVESPSAVVVTDAHGKAVQLRADTTHEDLAALVCSQGCKLHLRPTCGKADAAAAIATETDGRVLLPGDGPVSGRTIADKVLTALKTHDEKALMTLADELKLLGLVNTTEASRAFISTVTGTPLAGVSEEWQQCLDSLFVHWRERGAITITAAEPTMEVPPPEAASLEISAPVAAPPAVAAPVEESVGDAAPADVTIAAEQAFLATDAPRMSGSGTSIELMETLQFLHVTGKTGCLVIGSDPTPLRVWMANGGVVHAEEGTVTGLEAADALVRDPSARQAYAFWPDEQPPATSISVPTPMLLLDITRQMDEQGT